MHLQIIIHCDVEYPYPVSAKKMKGINDLLSTRERMKIFELIVRQDDTFTSKGLFDLLQEEGVSLTITSIQTFLNGLTYREYLTLTPIKTSKTPGRATFFFQRNKAYNLPIQEMING